MNKIKNWTLVGLTVVIMILLLKIGCNSSKSNTTYIKGKDITSYDTIYRPKEIIKFRDNWYPKPVITYVDSSLNHLYNSNDSTRVYNDTLNDKNLAIFVHSKTLGRLIDTKIAYTLKTPLEVIKTISRIDTLTRPNKFNIYGGLSLIGSKTTFDIAPYLALNIKNNNIFASYSIVNKQYQLGVGIRLFKSHK